jgi:hypothetical protein
VRSVAGSLAEAMLMTEPVAYAAYLRCKAGAEGQRAPGVGEQVVSARKSAAPTAFSPGSVIHDPAAKTLPASI